MKKYFKNKIVIGFILALLVFVNAQPGYSQTKPTTVYLPISLSPTPATYQVNMPYFNIADVIGAETFREMAIFWFGRIGSNDNYADVRVGYNSTTLFVYVAAVDRLFWYDTTPSIPDLPNWDGISLYVNTAGVGGENPTATSFRFDSQISPGDKNRKSYQAGYQGMNSNWSVVAVPFETIIGERGESGYNSGGDNRGWVISYKIPFSSLGISGRPADGTDWGIGVAMHDRDAVNGSVLEASWPPSVNFLKPKTWGLLNFGLAKYTPPARSVSGSVTVRQENAVSTPDGDVGGHFTCGEGIDWWNQWGNKVYYFNSGGSHVADLNVQNQSDIADWPCFSKYFITFPLNAIPRGKVILSAKLTMHQFGQSGDVNSPSSTPIQVLVVNKDFDEPTLSWNSAPLALENVALSWVPVINSFPEWPGVPRTWDISYAADKAYRGNQPLRLALYTADNAYHSGRYFVSADTDDWNKAGRPTIVITYGNP